MRRIFLGLLQAFCAMMAVVSLVTLFLHLVRGGLWTPFFFSEQQRQMMTHWSQIPLQATLLDLGVCLANLIMWAILFLAIPLRKAAEDVMPTKGVAIALGLCLVSLSLNVARDLKFPDLGGKSYYTLQQKETIETTKTDNPTEPREVRKFTDEYKLKLGPIVESLALPFVLLQVLLYCRRRNKRALEKRAHEKLLEEANLVI